MSKMYKPKTSLNYTVPGAQYIRKAAKSRLGAIWTFWYNM
jgi:hypothetical protein